MSIIFEGRRCNRKPSTLIRLIHPAHFPARVSQVPPGPIRSPSHQQQQKGRGKTRQDHNHQSFSFFLSFFSAHHQGPKKGDSTRFDVWLVNNCHFFQGHSFFPSQQRPSRISGQSGVSLISEGTILGKFRYQVIGFLTGHRTDMYKRFCRSFTLIDTGPVHFIRS